MLTPEPGKPRIKETDVAVGDITGVIGLTGHSEDSLAVSFSEACALEGVGNMIGEKYEEMNEVVADADGELTDMFQVMRARNYRRPDMILRLLFPRSCGERTTPSAT